MRRVARHWRPSIDAVGADPSDGKRPVSVTVMPGIDRAPPAD